MVFPKFRDLVMPIVTLILVVVSSAAVIAYGRGYRLDVTQKSLTTTGLIAATSDPTGAQVLVDNVLKTATNNTIPIAPGWYSVSIVKEGYQSWEKKLRVQGEIVSRADAYLFPNNPSLSTLTTYGVLRPTLSPDGINLAYVVPTNPEATNGARLVPRAGIWIYETGNRPLSLSRDARQIAKSATIDWTDSILTWAPDSKQILVARPGLSNSWTYYLLDADRMNDFPQAVPDITLLKSQWQVLKDTKHLEQLSSLTPQLAATVSSVMNVISFSPEETKILYEASTSATLQPMITPELIGTNSTGEVREIKPGMIYVYDIKEDKNFEIGPASDFGFPTPEIPANKIINSHITPTPATGAIDTRFITYTPPPPIHWLPTDRHLIIVSKEKIEVMDFDKTNRKTIYAGPFEAGFAAPWNNASRILILTNLNPIAGNIPNLYAVNLR